MPDARLPTNETFVGTGFKFDQIVRNKLPALRMTYQPTRTAGAVDAVSLQSDGERTKTRPRAMTTEVGRALSMQRSPTVGAVDVHYDELGKAKAALVTCRELTFSTVASEHIAFIDRVAPYEPGTLFKRELPCIQEVLALGPPLELLVIDGYATLDPSGRPGLGAHAAAAIGVPVIGVAKTPFRTATHAAEVIRGTATRPLYVTAAGGLATAEAARIVAAMEGPNRIPAALARADRLARGRIEPINARNIT